MLETTLAADSFSPTSNADAVSLPSIRAYMYSCESRRETCEATLQRWRDRLGRSPIRPVGLWRRGPISPAYRGQRPSHVDAGAEGWCRLCTIPGR